MNRASDDAAGLAIASGLKTDTRIFSQSVRNINDGMGLLDVAEGALGELKNVLVRIRELAVQSSNGTLGTVQRRALDREADQLTAEFNRIIESVSFNDIKPLDSQADSLEIQAGASSSLLPLLLSLGSSLARDVGTGTFAASATIAVTQPRSFIAGDVNGDGLDDVVVSRYSTGVLLLSNGDGTFSYGQPVYMLPSGGTHSLDSNDFNNDGRLDLVARDASSVNFAVILGNGDGTFSVGQTYASLYAGLASTVSGDLNNDGNQDIVIANAASSAQVMLGNGNGTFRAASNIGAATASRLTIEDVSGDGYADLVGGNQIFLGNGNGTFRAPSIFDPAGAGVRVAVADFNNDGYYDLVSGSAGSSMSYYFGNGDGTFRAGRTVAAGASWPIVSVSAVDLNDDGLSDLVTYGSAQNTFMTALLSNGDGTFRAPNSYYASAGGSGEMSAPAIGRFRSSGVIDIAVPGSGNSMMQFYSANTESSTRLRFFNLANKEDAIAALPEIDLVLNRASKELGALGAFRSRLLTAGNNVRVARENFAAAASQILDVDVAQESAHLIRSNILQQAASAVLSQANLLPDLALRLLRG